MAYLQVRLEQSDGADGCEVPLNGDDEVCFLASDPGRCVAVACGQQPSDTVGYIFRHDGHNGAESWRLFAGDAQIYLNGRLLPLGMEVLRTGDEIRIGLCHMTFLTTRPAHAEAAVPARRST